MRNNRNRSDWLLEILSKSTTYFKYQKVEDPTGIETLDAIEHLRPSNHFKTRVRYFKPGDYYGPRTQDFVDRVSSFFIGANAVARDQEIYSDYKLKKLQELEQDAINFITTHCKISEENIRLIKEKNEQDKKLKIFKENFKRYQQYCEDIIYKVLALLLDSDNKKNAELLLMEIDQAERAHIAKTGRPSIIHKYHIPLNSYNNRLFVSSHQVITHLTPSQILFKRKWTQLTGNHSGFETNKDNPFGTNSSTTRDTEGLSNLLRASFIDYTNPNSPQLLFEATRHSSFPAIKLQDEIRRHAIALRNAEQLVIQLARQAIANGKINNDGSVSISLSSISLLSDDIFEIFRGNENENRQILESELAIKFLDQQTFYPHIEGAKRKVHITSSFMSMGCNNLRNLGLNRTQNRINRRGLVEHLNAMYCFLQKHIEISHLKNIKYEKSLGEINSIKAMLATKYKQLRINAEHYENTILSRASNELIQEKRKTYYELLEEINKLEKTLDNIYQNCYEEQKIIWEKQKDNIIYHGEDDSLENLLNLFSDLNALYFENNGLIKKYASDEYYFQFQARYLISSFLIGNYPDFFCKSGEDRTGRINNIIEELLAKFSITGHISRYNEIDTECSAYVHDYSASRETTALNAWGARGLQIKKNQGSDHLLTEELDRTMATIAKKIYPKISFSFLNLFRHIFNPPYKKIKSSLEAYLKEKANETYNEKPFTPIISGENTITEGFGYEDTKKLTAAISQASFLITETNIEETNKQILGYLQLIHHLTHTTDPSEKTKLLSNSSNQNELLRQELLGTESNSGETFLLNPWLHKLSKLDELRQQLSSIKEALENAITFGENLKVNKLRLEAVNQTLGDLNNKDLTFLLKANNLINRWLNAPNTVNEHEIKLLAPSHISLSTDFPFIVHVNDPIDDFDTALSTLQRQTATHLKPHLEKHIGLFHEKLNSALNEQITPRVNSYKQNPIKDLKINKNALSKTIQKTFDFDTLEKLRQDLQEPETELKNLPSKLEQLSHLETLLTNLIDPFEEAVKLTLLTASQSAATLPNLEQLVPQNFRGAYKCAKAYLDLIEQERSKINFTNTDLQALKDELSKQESSLIQFYTSKPEEQASIDKSETNSEPAQNTEGQVSDTKDTLISSGLTLASATAATLLFGLNPAVLFGSAVVSEGINRFGRPASEAVTHFFQKKNPGPSVESNQQPPVAGKKN